MRFVDEAQISMIGGHGGPGCVSFRREAFAPRGGPDGGDGGKGGSIIIVASSQLATLQDFRFKKFYQARNGNPGSSANKTGHDGASITLQVPIGTVVKNPQTGEILSDFLVHDQTWVACKGGRGGKGNAHFTTSTYQSPKFAQPGEEGETREIRLELKLLADVGLVGFPNAGKSTLISKISAARPKIADYPFTTLTPHLGVVSMPGYPSFTVADIPGLIEGAHRGVGLGHKFLKHIERTKLFVHLLDATPLIHHENTSEALEKIIQSYQAIRNELRLFNETLLDKQEIVAISKSDLFELEPKVLLKAQKILKTQILKMRNLPLTKEEPFIISGINGTGLKALLTQIYKAL